MLIGIISDTHDCINNTMKAFEFFNKKQTDLVLHCGDWIAPFMLEAKEKLNCALKGVFGNNEGDRHIYYEKIKNDNLDIEISNEGVWEGEIDGKNIAVTHGHQPIILKLLLESGKYDLVASGHTHDAKKEQYDNTTHVNPGAVMGAKMLEIKDKFSLALYDTESGEVSFHYF